MSVELGGNILVTGSNRGIGLELVRQLAARSEDAHVYACCRDPEGPGAEVRPHKRGLSVLLFLLT